MVEDTVSKTERRKPHQGFESPPGRQKIPLMKILFAVLLMVPAITFAAESACPADKPHMYRVAFNYHGGKTEPMESGSIVEVGCLEREITTEADWDWLQKRIETTPKVTRIVIMSAVPLADKPANSRASGK